MMIVESDILAHFRSWVQTQPGLAALCGTLPAWRVVVDANVLIQDVCYRFRLRNPEARTSLEELVANGSVEAFTTFEAIREVEKHLPAQAERLACCAAELLAIWGRYRAVLQVVEPHCAAEAEVAAIRRRDPKDVHLVAGAVILEADAILTYDRDFEVTSIPSFRRPTLLAMRDVARLKATEVMLRVGPSVLGTLGVVLVAEVCRLLPREALMIVAIALGLALLDPAVRGRLREVLAEVLRVGCLMMSEGDAQARKMETRLLEVAAAGLPATLGSGARSS